MTISIQWDNDDKTIIHIRFPDKWTWEEFYEIDKTTRQMLNTVSHKVVYLVDVSQTRITPIGLKLEIIRQVLDFRHENSDLLIITGMNPILYALFDIIVLALGRINTRIEVTNDLKEAYRIARFRLLEIERGGG